MSRRASLQYPQSQLLLQQPSRLSALNTMTCNQRLGSQPALFYHPNMKSINGGGSFVPINFKDEPMPQHITDSQPEHHHMAYRQQRRSQPSIFAVNMDMHPQLISAKSGPLAHSQPTLYYEHLYALRTPPLIQRTQNSNSSSKTGSPSIIRRLPRPPPERRVLRRSPQSDLFPRFQQHRQQIEAVQFPNEILQTKLEASKSFR